MHTIMQVSLKMRDDYTIILKALVFFFSTIQVWVYVQIFLILLQF